MLGTAGLVTFGQIYYNGRGAYMYFQSAGGKAPLNIFIWKRRYINAPVYLMVCARLAQLVGSLTANHEVPGSITGLVEG